MGVKRCYLSQQMFEYTLKNEKNKSTNDTSVMRRKRKINKHVNVSQWNIYVTYLTFMYM